MNILKILRTRSKHTLQSHPLVRNSKHMRIVFAWRTSKKSKERCTTSGILSARLMLTLTLSLSIFPLSISCSQSRSRPPLKKQQYSRAVLQLQRSHTNTRKHTSSCEIFSISFCALPRLPSSAAFGFTHCTSNHYRQYRIERFAGNNVRRRRVSHPNLQNSVTTTFLFHQKSRYFPFDNLPNTFALVWLRFATLKTV